jgi:hypothetical protein
MEIKDKALEILFEKCVKDNVPINEIFDVDLLNLLCYIVL